MDMDVQLMGNYCLEVMDLPPYKINPQSMKSWHHNEDRRYRVPPNFLAYFHPSDVIDFGANKKVTLRVKVMRYPPKILEGAGDRVLQDFIYSNNGQHQYLKDLHETTKMVADKTMRTEASLLFSPGQTLLWRRAHTLRSVIGPFTMTPTISAEPTTAGNPTSERSPTATAGTLRNSSSQLNRWSRARVIRSGRKLDRPVQPKPQQNIANADQHFHRPEGGEPAVRSTSFSSSSSEDDTSGKTDEVFVKGKEIYLVSDGSGRTAEHSVNAALGQFEHFLIEGGCPVYTRLFSGINDLDRLMEIIMQAAKEDAILIYTLADENLADSARQACKSWGVQSTDVLRPITDAIASYLGISPSRLPRGAPGRRFPLTEEYFKRIDAIEFTIKQDDGAFLQNLHKADIVVAGVSRSGKTPLSIYLAQKGFKVANVPIVKGVDLPKTLFEIDPNKVFALTLNPAILHTIRLERAKSLGYLEEEKTDYAEMVHVREELDYASKIFTQNPTWPVIEVSGRAIEEIAAIILRIYQDRKHGPSIPRISKLY